MFIIGLALTCFSAPIAISMFSNPGAYYYAYGLSESDIAPIAIISSIAAMIGICLMIFGLISRKNKAALIAVENHSKMTFCPKCNVNVVSSNGLCPICGGKLEKR